MLQIWDTAGQERFSRVSAFFRAADAAVLMYDVTALETLFALSKWWAELKDKAPVREEEHPSSPPDNSCTTTHIIFEAVDFANIFVGLQYGREHVPSAGKAIVHIPLRHDLHLFQLNYKSAARLSLRACASKMDANAQVFAASVLRPLPLLHPLTARTSTCLRSYACPSSPTIPTPPTRIQERWTCRRQLVACAYDPGAAVRFPICEGACPLRIDTSERLLYMFCVYSTFHPLHVSTADVLMRTPASGVRLPFAPASSWEPWQRDWDRALETCYGRALVRMVLVYVQPDVLKSRLAGCEDTSMTTVPPRAHGEIASRLAFSVHLASGARRRLVQHASLPHLAFRPSWTLADLATAHACRRMGLSLSLPFLRPPLHASIAGTGLPEERITRGRAGSVRQEVAAPSLGGRGGQRPLGTSGLVEGLPCLVLDDMIRLPPLAVGMYTRLPRAPLASLLSAALDPPSCNPRLRSDGHLPSSAFLLSLMRHRYDRALGMLIQLQYSSTVSLVWGIRDEFAAGRGVSTIGRDYWALLCALRVQLSSIYIRARPRCEFHGLRGVEAMGEL
ncbi:Ras-domain-containing protein [Mycena venus]|uniref:Ras-domain-containing protein n=1 Tax=Mycena venus TaxID=2733690 RepID=A0A8H6Z3C1_9AGAR|nr:Ras-domain-containing protein [Mycena venus]